MSEILIRERGRTWNPLKLGQSLPITEGMRWSRRAVLVITVLGLVAVLFVVRSVISPSSAPRLGEAASRTLVVEVLKNIPKTIKESRQGLPLWDPSGDLSSVEPPEFLFVRDAGLHTDRSSKDPELAPTLNEAHTFLRQGRLRRALALYLDVARREPNSWPARYHAGLARARQKKWPEARKSFEEALEILDKKAAKSPDDWARVVATNYSLGLALLREGRLCEHGIKRLKNSINALKEYIPLAMKARPPLIYATDVNDLFSLHGFDLDSYQIRNALIEGYLQCERYPEEYFKKWPWAKGFHQSEYDDRAHPEIQGGPFPEELAACVGESVPGRRCWALSNLNQLYYSSRNYLPVEGSDWAWDPEIKDSYGSLVQMVYNIAVLMADRPDTIPAEKPALRHDRLTSADFLEMAATVNEYAQVEDLRSRIEQFARYLAWKSEDFRVLALRYRNTPTADLRFAVDSTPDELKGMAGALRLRFEDYLENQKPENIPRDLDIIRGNLTERSHLESLAEWRRQIEIQLRDALAAAMSVEDERDQTSKALAIRDYRADFLGSAWTWKAFQTWLTRGRTAVLLAAVVLYLLLVAACVLIHRLVVYPYLIYTAHFYESEFQRRHGKYQDEKKAFTGEEIRKQEDQRRAAGISTNPVT